MVSDRDAADHRLLRGPSLLACIGAVMAAAAIGFSAYAAHAVGDAHIQANLRTAAQYLFAHGLALAALAPFTIRRLGRMSLAMLLAGVLLFSGSLIGNALLQWPTRWAPFGGIMMMLGWCVWAVDALRR
ncbi:MAG: DUF423 domain-containing protein [Xanthomonadaceae bacterium]|jgi:uncharacterized membrane protein YgdD (TMEM256/DUF423 family)|nr:DUF423 domain-containing protein [Xanthomonadaceae bacterium]